MLCETRVVSRAIAALALSSHPRPRRSWCHQRSLSGSCSLRRRCAIICPAVAHWCLTLAGRPLLSRLFPVAEMCCCHCFLVFLDLGTWDSPPSVVSAGVQERVKPRLCNIFLEECSMRDSRVLFPCPLPAQSQLRGSVCPTPHAQASEHLVSNSPLSRGGDQHWRTQGCLQIQAGR